MAGSSISGVMQGAGLTPAQLTGVARARKFASMLDRMAIYQGGTRSERERLHRDIAALKAEAIDGRLALAADYLARHRPSWVIDRATGLGFADLTEPSAPARREIAAMLAEGRPMRRSKGSLEYLLYGDDFSPAGEVIRFATSPAMVAPVTAYFGAVPILFNAFVTRATAAKLLPTTSHMFHVDPEDVTSIKVFVHLTDVDADCGPFHALPADASEAVVAALGYRVGRVPDADVERITDIAPIPAIGPAGFAAACDTTRCLHFGGRPRAVGKPARELLVLHYVLPTCFLLPAAAGDERSPQHAVNLPPTGDPFLDALGGSILN